MFQSEIVKTDAARADAEDGVKRRRGRRFIRWSFGRMWVNNAPSFLTKFRQKNTLLSTSVIVVHTCLGTMKQGLEWFQYYKQLKGSPWINTFAEAERWLNAQEIQRLDLDSIERPNTK